MANDPTIPSENPGAVSPPRSTQFKKGVSGNPNGRPKKTVNTSKVLNKALRQRVKVNVDGKQKKVTKMEAMATQLANKGAQGDARATQQVLTTLHKLGEADESSPVQRVPTETDHLVIANVVARILKSNQGADNEPNNS